MPRPQVQQEEGYGQGKTSCLPLHWTAAAPMRPRARAPTPLAHFAPVRFGDVVRMRGRTAGAAGRRRGAAGGAAIGAGWGSGAAGGGGSRRPACTALKIV